MVLPRTPHRTCACWWAGRTGAGHESPSPVQFLKPASPAVSPLHACIDLAGRTRCEYAHARAWLRSAESRSHLRQRDRSRRPRPRPATARDRAAAQEGDYWHVHHSAVALAQRLFADPHRDGAQPEVLAQRARFRNGAQSHAAVSGLKHVRIRIILPGTCRLCSAAPVGAGRSRTR